MDEVVGGILNDNMCTQFCPCFEGDDGDNSEKYANIDDALYGRD